mgnify:CR=1 FL=1
MKAQKGGKPDEERQKALKQPINLHFIYISNAEDGKVFFPPSVFYATLVVYLTAGRPIKTF